MNPALHNMQPNFQAMIGKLGLEVLAVRFEGHATAPVWTVDNLGARIGEELQRETVGEYDSLEMVGGSLWLFFHVNDLARGLEVLRRALLAHELINYAMILHAESESGLRQYWPATATLYGNET